MSSQDTGFPQNCGRRLLPSVVDSIAASDPQKTCFSIANTDNPKFGFKDISFSLFAHAVNRCAWWMVDNLGHAVNFPTLFTYLPPHDLRHAILILASNKTGYKASVCGENALLVSRLHR